VFCKFQSVNTLVNTLKSKRPLFQVRDVFFSDFRGRKVTVLAPSRGVAASGIRSLLYHLVSRLDRNHSKYSLAQSEWRYMDLKHNVHGPYSFAKMLRWAQAGAFPTDSLPIQHTILHCWLPLWFIHFLSDQSSRDGMLTTQPAGAEEPEEEVIMMDWEETVAKLNADRQKGSLVQPTKVLEFEEYQIDQNGFDATPMDYDVSNAIGDLTYLSDVVRVVVVIDTNVLLSHLTVTERIFSRLMDKSPAMETLLLVPWIVLCELDKLKDHKHERLLADAARFALRRLRLLISQRDSFVKAQSSMEHARIAKHADGLLEHATLKNDDYILKTCLAWENGKIQTLRSSGTRAAVLLLSNDTGLCARARANGIRSFTANEFSAAAGDLSKEILPVPEPGPSPVPFSLKLQSNISRGLAGHPTDRSTSRLPVVDGEHESHQRQDLPDLLQEESEPIISAVSSIVQMCLVPAIAYYRQQDLGDLWIELLEEELRPPWDASAVLKVIIRHETTFWGVFSENKKHFLGIVRKLEAMLRKYSRCPSEMPGPDSIVAVESCLELFVVLQRGLDTPLSDNPPDPSSVPDFVSFGQARGALMEGISKLTVLLRCSSHEGVR
jgi:rRNA-processing protein FCF1